MILVRPSSNAESEEYGYGIFNSAVYDDDGSFLGCVSYSNQFLDENNGGELKATRFFTIFLLVAITLSAILAVFIQCFSKSGKSFLWQVMGWSYAFALACQVIILVFSIRSTETLEDLNGEGYKSYFGPNIIGAIFNLGFLFAMTLACFISLPPRNPVFRLWNEITMDYDTDKHNDTDDDASDPENPTRAVSKTPKRLSSEENDAVSLFSGQISKRSKSSGSISKKSGRSKSLRRTIKQSKDDTSSKAQSKASSKSGSKSKQRPPRIDEEEVETRSHQSSKSDKNSKSSTRESAERSNSNSSKEGDQSTASGIGDGSKTSDKKNGSSIDETLPQEYTLDTPNTDPEASAASVNASTVGSSVAGSKKSKSTSVAVMSASSTAGSKQSKSTSVAVMSATSKSRKSAATASTNDSVQSNQENDESLNGQRALADFLTLDGEQSTQKSDSKRSNKSSARSTKSALSAKSTRTADSVNTAKFLNRLKSSTKIDKGGFRRSETLIGQKLELVDEYPVSDIDGVHPPHDLDGTDIVKVRTEYYPEGRKTIKEEIHHDGSRTVSTLIEPLNVGEGVEVDLDGGVK